MYKYTKNQFYIIRFLDKTEDFFSQVGGWLNSTMCSVRSLKLTTSLSDGNNPLTATGIRRRYSSFPDLPSPPFPLPQMRRNLLLLLF